MASHETVDGGRLQRFAKRFFKEFTKRPSVEQHEATTREAHNEYEQKDPSEALRDSPENFYLAQPSAAMRTFFCLVVNVFFHAVGTCFHIILLLTASGLRLFPVSQSSNESGQAPM